MGSAMNGGPIFHIGDIIKPDFDKEVYPYAQAQIAFYQQTFANGQNHEHLDEMYGEAMLRVHQAYLKFEKDKGWKTFVQNHCRGAVLDYLKMGRHFAEKNKTITNPARAMLKRYPDMIRKRYVAPRDKDSATEVDDLERTLNKYHHLLSDDKQDTGIHIDWEIISIMARLDKDLHILAKILLGFTIRELSTIFGLKKKDIEGRVEGILQRVDDPNYMDDTWINNIIWHLGLNDILGMDKEPPEIEFRVEPIDLYSFDPIDAAKIPIQLSFKL